MLRSLPAGRRVTALVAAAAVVLGGLLVGTRVGAAPEPDRYTRQASSAVPGLDPALLEVAGRRAAGPSVAGTAAAPRRDATGRVVVHVEGEETAVRSAVRAVGGVVTGAVPGRVRASVPAAALVRLAGAPGVDMVRAPRAPRTDALTSEGVAASEASGWQAAGQDGNGVKVGIVDAGYAGLAAATQAGEVPTGLALTPGGDFCSGGPDQTEHGTGVAEIVHDMAPGATIVLTCIEDDIGLAQAAAFLKAQGVKIVTMSLSFEGGGRGDGSGATGTPADTVRRSRADGLLWTVAAGNAGATHWNGTVVDTDRDRAVDIVRGGDDSQAFTVPADSVVSVSLQWDAWPVTHEDLDLLVMGVDRTPESDADIDLVAVSEYDHADPNRPAAPPTEYAVIDNTGRPARRVYAFVMNYRARDGMRYDLSMLGGAAQVEHVSGGSVSEPASSPYVLAVGAACAATGARQPYSGRGPTIDGRTKPDLTAYDAVSGVTYGAATDCDTGFTGTSAAAPHVAGAAAVLLARSGGLPASLLEDQLLRRVDAAAAPKKDNDLGRGRLRLGAPGPVGPPASSAYTPLARPVRVLDTRSASGPHPGPLPGGVEYTLPVVPAVPADATAVLLNVTGTGGSSETYVSVYPQAYSGTSSLNLARGQTAANLVTTELAQGAVKLRNAAGNQHVIVDVVGYYAAGGTSTYLARSAPVRVLDTRTATGGHRRPLGAAEQYALLVRGVGGVPADASAVVLNVTGTAPTSASTHLAVYPQTNPGTSTLNLLKGQTRANLAVTGIGSDGKVRFYNATGSTHAVADLVGWYVPGSAGGRFVPLQVPGRILDTRTGNGLRLGPLGSGQALTVTAAGLGPIPATASAVVGNLTGTRPTAGSYLSAYPAGAARPATSTLNMLAGATVPNAVQVRPGTGGGVTVYNSAGSTQVLLDVSGYFTAAGQS